MPETLTVNHEYIERAPDFPVLISKFESQSEQRRIKTSKLIQSFMIGIPNSTQTQMEYYDNFHTARYGSAYGFYFVYHSVTYNVRFEPGSFKVRSEGGVYRIEFSLIVINQDEM